MPTDKDLIRLRHILDAIDEAASFVSGKSKQVVESDRMLALSLVKRLK